MKYNCKYCGLWRTVCFLYCVMLRHYRIIIGTHVSVNRRCWTPPWTVVTQASFHWLCQESTECKQVSGGGVRYWVLTSNALWGLVLRLPLFSCNFRRVARIAKSDYLASSRLSVRPSVPIEQLGSHWTDIHKLLYLSILLKPLEKIQIPLKSGNNNGSYVGTYVRLWQNVAESFLEWEIFQKKFV